MNFIDVFISVVFLLLLAVPGFILAKVKFMPNGADGVLSTLVLYVCQPMLVLMSFQKTRFTPEVGINMLIVAGLTILVHLLMIFFMFLVYRHKTSKKIEAGIDATIAEEEARGQKINCLRFAGIFSNCGFMGLPFLQSLFAGKTGIEGEILVYAGVVIAIFNLFTWSVGVFIVSGDRKQISVKKAIFNPTVIALIVGVLLFLVSPLPLKDLATQGGTLDKILEQLVKSFTFLAEMVTPLSMTVIGIKLANSNLKRIFLDKWAYVSAFNKLIVMSLVSMLVVAFLPISSIMKYCIFFLLSMPSATNTVMFAVRFGGDSDSGTVFVLLSTMLSCVTIPLMFLLMNGVFGIAI